MSLHTLGACVCGGGGGGGGHGGGGHGGHGGGFHGGGLRGGFAGPGWGWGPYVDVVDVDPIYDVTDLLEREAQTDDLAERVAEKLAKKTKVEGGSFEHLSPGADGGSYAEIVDVDSEWGLTDPQDVELIAHKHGLFTLGAESAAPMFDMVDVTNKLNAVFGPLRDGQPTKVVSVKQARSMTLAAMPAAEAAVKYGIGIDSKRQLTVDKLQWHLDNMEGKADDADYASKADLRVWLVQAMVEFNAAQDSIEQTERNSILQAIWESIKELPVTLSKVTEAISSKVSAVVKSVTGPLPVWAWALIGAGTLGLVSFAVIKVAKR